MRKKTLAWILAAMLMLTGCSQAGEPEEESSSLPAEDETSSQEESLEESSAEERTPLEEDLSIPGAISINFYDIYFEKEFTSEYDESAETYTNRYYCTGKLPADTNFSELPVLIEFNGDYLKIDGETMAVESPVMIMLDFKNSSHEMEVGFEESSRVYEVSAVSRD